jgi:hypothetical protein
MKKSIAVAIFLAPTVALGEDFAAMTKRIDDARLDYQSCLTKSATYYGQKLCRDVSELVPGAFGKCTDQRTILENLVRDRGDAPSERTRYLGSLRERYTDTMTAIILDQQIAANCQPK